jgi:hypothetical protein
MKAIRKNARKETIQYNISQYKKDIESYKSVIKYMNKEIKTYTTAISKCEKKLAELKALLKTKTL